MPTTTKKPSAELEKLAKRREKTFADLQDVKRQRAAFEDETEQSRADYTAFIAGRPEDWRDAARNPKPGSPSAKREAELKKRLSSPNPYEEAFILARSEFHEADDELQAFRRNHLVDVIAEQEPSFRAVEGKFNQALDLIIEVADDYAGLKARVEGLVRDTDGLTGQHVTSDPLPQQLRVMAETALEHGLSAPGLTEVGEWKLAQHG